MQSFGARRLRLQALEQRRQHRRAATDLDRLIGTPSLA
jgi:hypothetical protein